MTSSDFVFPKLVTGLLPSVPHVASSSGVDRSRYEMVQQPSCRPGFFFKSNRFEFDFLLSSNIYEYKYIKMTNECIAKYHNIFYFLFRLKRLICNIISIFHLVRPDRRR